MLLASLYLWLGLRQTICGGQESNKHFFMLSRLYLLAGQGQWGEALDTVPYPPGSYLVAGLLGLLCGHLNITIALLSQGLYIIGAVLGVYKLARLCCRPPEALTASGLLGALILFQIIKVGFLLDFTLVAWCAWTLYLLAKCQHFQKLKPTLGLAVCAGLGMWHKDCFPLYVMGAVVLEILYFLYQVICPRRLRLHFDSKLAPQRRPYRWYKGLGLMLLAMGITCAIALPWYIPYYTNFFRERYLYSFTSDQADSAPSITQFVDSALTGAGRKWNEMHAPNLDLGLVFPMALIGGALLCFPTSHRRRFPLASHLATLSLGLLILGFEEYQDIRLYFPLYTQVVILSIYWIDKLRLVRWLTHLVYAGIIITCTWVWLAAAALPPGSVPIMLNTVGQLRLSQFRDPLGLIGPAKTTYQEQVARQIRQYADQGYTPVIMPEKAFKVPFQNKHGLSKDMAPRLLLGDLLHCQVFTWTELMLATGGDTLILIKNDEAPNEPLLPQAGEVQLDGQGHIVDSPPPSAQSTDGPPPFLRLTAMDLAEQWNSQYWGQPFYPRHNPDLCARLKPLYIYLHCQGECQNYPPAPFHAQDGHHYTTICSTEDFHISLHCDDIRLAPWP